MLHSNKGLLNIRLYVALQIPTFSLVQLNSFKQGLEISSTETLNQTKSIINIYVYSIEKFSHNHRL